MKLMACSVLAVCLAGCAQLVEVRSNRGEMGLAEYRGVISELDEQLKDLDVVSGARISMRGDRTSITYAPSDWISARNLQELVLELYRDSHQEHPFTIEAVEIVSSRSRGVRVER